MEKERNRYKTKTTGASLMLLVLSRKLEEYMIWATSCAKYADLHHPAHVQSIIRAFALQSYIL